MTLLFSGDPEDLNLTWRERRFALPVKRREIILEEFCPGIGEGALFSVYKKLM